MTGDTYEVTVGAGSLRADSGWSLPHRWTPEGVSVEASFTGAHLLHLSIAGCVLNDVYREAGPLGVRVAGVRVRARGGFDTDSWASTGVAYEVEVDAPDAGGDDLQQLLDAVDAVAEIPRAVRQGAPVLREA
jgi:hypothetical protein